MLDAAQSGFDLLDADRTFFQRTQQSGAQLVLIERLAAAVLLDDARQHQLSRFEGSETLLAGQAFAPTTHLTAIGDQPGIDYLGVISAAKRTIHVRIRSRSEQRPCAGSLGGLFKSPIAYSLAQCY